VPDDLRLHIVAHLRFYLRNRLVLAFVLLVTGVAVLTLIPSLLYTTAASRFDSLKQLTTTLYGFASFATAGLGLLAMWSHVSTRSVKLILTSPSPPWRWVAAIIISAFAVTFVFHAAVTLFTFTLSLIWGVRYPIGFVFLALHSLCGTLVVLSFLTALATCIHPLIAALAILVLNDGLILRLRELVEAGVGSQSGGFLRTVRAALAWIYALMPMTNPFERQLQTVYGTLRVSGTDWSYLAAAAAYALAATTFFFVLSVKVLRRRTLI
jgi:hypothetical protein